MSQLFGPVQQLGYVVRDLDEAMRHWTQNLHIGPFYCFDHPAPGEPNRALTYSGPLQIELIEQHPGFTAPGGEGLHHIGFFSEHFDRDLQRAAEAGLAVRQSAEACEPAGKSTYFESAGHAGTVLKLIDLQSSNRELYRMVQTEAQRWDGSGPIRRIEV